MIEGMSVVLIQVGGVLYCHLESLTPLLEGLPRQVDVPDRVLSTVVLSVNNIMIFPEHGLLILIVAWRVVTS